MLANLRPGPDCSLINVARSSRHAATDRRSIVISRMENGSWLNPKRVPSHRSKYRFVLHAGSRWFGIAQFALTRIRQFAFFTAPNATRSVARSRKSNLDHRTRARFVCSDENFVGAGCVRTHPEIRGMPGGGLRWR